MFKVFENLKPTPTRFCVFADEKVYGQFPETTAIAPRVNDTAYDDVPDIDALPTTAVIEDTYDDIPTDEVQAQGLVLLWFCLSLQIHLPSR